MPLQGACGQALVLGQEFSSFFRGSAAVTENKTIKSPHVGSVKKSAMTPKKDPAMYRQKIIPDMINDLFSTCIQCKQRK
jgi:hypothetical protein